MLRSLRFLIRPAHRRALQHTSDLTALRTSPSHCISSHPFTTEAREEKDTAPSLSKPQAKQKKSKASRKRHILWDAACEEKYQEQLKQLDFSLGSKAQHRAAKKKLRKRIAQDRKADLAVADKSRHITHVGQKKDASRPSQENSGNSVNSSRGMNERRETFEGARSFKSSNSRTTVTQTYSKVVEGALKPIRSKTVLQELSDQTDYQHVARLSNGLDRVLFNPGMHWVQDPRSTVYNFSPYVQRIPDLEDFAFERLAPFTPSSRDRIMRKLAAKERKRFAGSTSSLSGLLSHIYFLLSRFQYVNTETLAAPFPNMSRKFTPGQRMPSAVVFRNKGNVYMVDSDNSDDDDSEWNVLCHMGTMLESFLTTSKSEFGKLLRSISDGKDTACAPSSYRYSKTKQFVMRSQLDCIDNRLPGTGIFDIKTRAVLPIRMDNLNFKANSSYTLNSQHGLYRSVDSEYYDLVRSAFLKYSFQARIGNMDGIFLAYHNTAQIFGFQYLPLEVIDAHIFGMDSIPHHDPTRIGWRVFAKCVQLLEVVAAEIVDCFPGQTVTCLAETRNPLVLNLWVQPVDDSKTTESPSVDIPEVDLDSGRPIVQLDIRVEHYLSGRKFDFTKDVFTSLEPWMMSYSVSRSDASKDIIRSRLESAKSRKYRPMIYPNGVGPDSIRQFMENLGFGNPANIPDPSKFEPADVGIEHFRRMAKNCKKVKNQTPEKWKIWQQTPYTDPSCHLSFPNTRTS